MTMTMGGVKLELRCPKKAYSVELDPIPDWTFEDLLSQLNALEIKINSGSKAPLPLFAKEKSRDISNWKSNARKSTSPFVMRVFEDDMDNFDAGDEEAHDQKTVAAKGFNFNDLYLSDNDEFFEAEPHLVEKVDLVESGLVELSREHQFKVKEEIRNQISALETELKSVNDKSISAVVRVEKYRKERSEMDRKLDTQYQRKIAEALDNHLTVVQRDLEVRSQIEERKIGIDAAYEDAKRKEAEEKLRLERAKAEAEPKRVEEAKRADEAKRGALEAQRRAANVAAAKKASEISKKPDTDATLGASSGQSGGPTPAAEVANKIRAAESALNLEQGRLQKLKQLDEEVQALKSSSNQNYRKYERQISKLIQQITGTTENVRQKEYELLKIFCDAHCPQSISTSAFAKKVVSNCRRPGNPAFAQAFVIVRITSKVRSAMDLILAELHKACIYTVPKHTHGEHLDQTRLIIKLLDSKKRMKERLRALTVI